MRVRYTATARAETDDIFRHISGRDPAAATAVAHAVKEAVTRLGLFPHIGTPTNDPAVFITIARPYDYLIFYTLERDAVIVRRVRHSARRRPQ